MRPAADEALPLRFSTEGRDSERASDELSALYEGSTWRSERTGGDYFYRYGALGDARLSFHTSEMRGHISGDVPVGPDYVVQWLTQGHGEYDDGRSLIRLGPGTPQLFPAYRPFDFWFSDYRQRLVHLDRGDVARVAAERAGGPVAAVTVDHHARLRPASVQFWHDAVAFVSRTLSRGDVPRLLWHELSRTVTVAFVELYEPATVSLAPVLLTPRHARLRAAVEYLHANAAAPLTPSDVAEAAGLSVRALQEAFQRTIGMPPLAYLREIRLDRVREELLRTEPGVTTVAEVARRWGFGHAGRFSSQYAARFGEPPSRTLGR